MEIARALAQTFKDAGYTPVPVPSSRDMKLVFEREGSKGDTLLFGDWSFKRVWYRARIQLIPIGQDRLLVKCAGYRLLNRGDSHFEEEHAIGPGVFQDLLEQTKGLLARTE